MTKRDGAKKPDVLVIGGGPAGAAVATFLQRRGHDCLILERARFPRYHVGESLIPATYGPLDRLGLLPSLQASSFPWKYSVRFVSPDGKESDPFYFFETIPGDSARTWQVNRADFDKLCLDNARKAGVEVRTRASVLKVLFAGERAVGAEVRSHGSVEKVRARVVIDASGRTAVVGSQLGLKEQPVEGFHKAAIWSYYRGGKRGKGVDAGETTVFRLRGGSWFWYIPLRNDLVSVGLVGPTDVLFPESSAHESVFMREVDGCSGLRQRLSAATREGRAFGLRELAYRNRQNVGDGWVMVGDAAAFLDPVYSSGIFLALTSAELAAESVHDALESDDLSAARIGAFMTALDPAFETIRRLILAFYDPSFSFHDFVDRFPEHRRDLIECLVGDVIGKDMSSFLSALEQMTPALPITTARGVSLSPADSSAIEEER